MKSIIKFFILSCFFIIPGFSQNIINTLGSSGIFSIKDNSTTFLSMNQVTGYVELTRSLRLTNTLNSTDGIIYKGGSRFLHNYSFFGTLGNNTFLGVNSGNFTMANRN
jgi:hypothetical protein